jgi:hypothetical protein
MIYTFAWSLRVAVGEQVALTGALGAGYLVNEPFALARMTARLRAGR